MQKYRGLCKKGVIGNLDPDEKEEEGDPKETNVVERRSFVKFFPPFL